MLCWLDLETTSLDPREGAILEVGIIITSDDLDVKWRTSRVCRYYGSWENVHPAVVEMHTKSELRAECASGRVSEQTMSVVGRELAKLLRENVAAEGGIMLCGSTIGFDRSFLKEHMPDLLACFHYRSIDVSTLTELVRRWFPEIYAERPGADESKRPHRALPDLENSIALLRYYRETMLKRHRHDEDGGPR